MDLRRRLVEEPLPMQHVQHGLTLSRNPARAVASPRRRPRRHTRPRSPSSGSPSQWPASLDLVGLEPFQRDPQEFRNFFLEGDDRLRPLESRH